LKFREAKFQKRCGPQNNILLPQAAKTFLYNPYKKIVRSEAADNPGK
jgi:hypothetical protein